MKYIITEEESERISVLKVWLSFMVVFIHSYSEKIDFASGTIALEVPKWIQSFKYVVSIGISRCAVPAFFLISSILLFKKENFDWKTNIIKKCKTLLLPYFFLNTFWIAFFYLAQKIPFLKNYFADPMNYVSGWTLSDWIDKYLGYTGYPLCYPLWFLRDLFVLNVIANVLKRLIDKFPKFIFVVLMFLWMINVDTHMFCVSMQSLFFFAMGYYIVKYNIRISCIDKIKGSYISVIYICLLLIELLLQNRFVGFIHNIGIVVGIAFWFRCTTVLKEGWVSRLVHVVSRYTFGVYIFHEMNLTILKKICCKILPQIALVQMLEYIGIPIIIVICCIVLCLLMEKWFPLLYSALMGGRKR